MCLLELCNDKLNAARPINSTIFVLTKRHVPCIEANNGAAKIRACIEPFVIYLISQLGENRPFSSWQVIGNVRKPVLQMPLRDYRSDWATITRRLLQVRMIACLVCLAAFLDLDLDLDADQTLGQGRRPVATDHPSSNHRFLIVILYIHFVD